MEAPVKLRSGTPQDFIDEVLEDTVELRSETLPTGWVLPPSLMALPAVPGAPVVQTRAETKLPKDVRVKASLHMLDPYLQFMPVAAVPDNTTNTQQDRRPKDVLDTFELNFDIQKTFEDTIIAPTTRASAPLSPVTPSRRVNEPSQTQVEDK